MDKEDMLFLIERGFCFTIWDIQTGEELLCGTTREIKEQVSPFGTDLVLEKVILKERNNK